MSSRTNYGAATGVDLKRLVRPPASIRWPDDVRRIREALNRMGYDATDSDIQAAYEQYSDEEMCAGWIIIDSFDEKADGAAEAAMRYLVGANGEDDRRRSP